MKEIELLNDKQRESLLKDFAQHQASKLRRAQRTQWIRTARTWAAVVLTGILAGGVIALGHLTGTW